MLSARKALAPGPRPRYPGIVNPPQADHNEIKFNGDFPLLAPSFILPSEFPPELDSQFKKIMPFLSPRKDLLPAFRFSISFFPGIEKVSLSAGNFPLTHPAGRSAGEPSF
jgi:hypothetical protein